MEEYKTLELIQFKDYFKIADFVILAENSGHGKHSREILAFIEQFHSQLRGVFIEDTMSRQSSYDHYVETGEVDEEMESFFRGAMKEGKDLRGSTLALLDRAKKYNLPVICYDASKEKTDEAQKRATHGYYFLRGQCRDEDMFNNVNDYYNQNPGKYVAIIGSHHMTDENFEGDYDNFGPRMKKEFREKCVAVRMTNKDKYKKTKDRQNPIYDDVIILG